jgi:hypothetical protein
MRATRHVLRAQQRPISVSRMLLTLQARVSAVHNDEDRGMHVAPRWKFIVQDLARICSM